MERLVPSEMLASSMVASVPDQAPPLDLCSRFNRRWRVASHKSTHTHWDTYIQTDIHSYIPTDLHVYMHACIHAYTYIYIDVHTYMWIYIYTSYFSYMCAGFVHMCVSSCFRVCSYRHVCIYVHTQAMYTHTCMHYANVYMLICVVRVRVNEYL